MNIEKIPSDVIIGIFLNYIGYSIYDRSYVEKYIFIWIFYKQCMNSCMFIRIHYDYIMTENIVWRISEK